MYYFNMMAAVVLLLLLSMISLSGGERVWFGPNDSVINQSYENHNIFIVNGTTVTLAPGYSITGPRSSDDGEDAVRVEDATFIANGGVIRGGFGIGGTGVTISTKRDSEYGPGKATFQAGVEVYGGDATMEKTTRGGDAVQIIQDGSIATFNGGTFVPGTGCSTKVCGVYVDGGNAIQILQGKAIIYGGTFEGDIYNIQGDLELHGCIEYDADSEHITGTLNDGSEIDVAYAQPKGQNRPPSIIYNEDACPTKETSSSESAQTNASHMMMKPPVYISLSVVLGLMSIYLISEFVYGICNETESDTTTLPGETSTECEEEEDGSDGVVGDS